MAIAWNQEDFSPDAAVTEPNADLSDLLHHKSKCCFVLELVEDVDLILEHFSSEATKEWAKIGSFLLDLLLSFLEVVWNLVKFFLLLGQKSVFYKLLCVLCPRRNGVALEGFGCPWKAADESKELLKHRLLIVGPTAHGLKELFDSVSRVFMQEF